MVKRRTGILSYGGDLAFQIIAEGYSKLNKDPVWNGVPKTSRACGQVSTTVKLWWLSSEGC